MRENEINYANFLDSLKTNIEGLVSCTNELQQIVAELNQFQSSPKKEYSL